MKKDLDKIVKMTKTLQIKTDMLAEREKKINETNKKKEKELAKEYDEKFHKKTAEFEKQANRSLLETKRRLFEVAKKVATMLKTCNKKVENLTLELGQCKKQSNLIEEGTSNISGEDLFGS